MPFTSLLLAGLASNRQVEENDVSVIIRQDKKDDEQDNEIFLLFSSDNCDYFHKGFLKKIQKTENEPSCCDAICFAQVMENQKPKIIICFVELKGGGSSDDFSKAVDQIAKTYESVKKGIEENLDIGNTKTKRPKITWKALIINKSAMLQQEKEQKLNDLRKKMGPPDKNVQHTSGSNINLTYFIKESRVVQIS